MNEVPVHPQRRTRRSARLLDVKAAQLGETDQPDPVQVTAIAPVAPIDAVEEEDE